MLRRKSSLRPGKPLRRTSWMQRGRTIKRVNAKRQRENSARAYGPKARRTWMVARACIVCGVFGYTQQHHVKNGGMSRKSDAANTIPLCRPHPDASGKIVQGCHQKYEGKRAQFEKDLGFTMEQAADAIERAWRTFSGQSVQFDADYAGGAVSGASV